MEISCIVGVLLYQFSGFPGQEAAGAGMHAYICAHGHLTKNSVCFKLSPELHCYIAQAYANAYSGTISFFVKPTYAIKPPALAAHLTKLGQRVTLLEESS